MNTYSGIRHQIAGHLAMIIVFVILLLQRGENCFR